MGIVTPESTRAVALGDRLTQILDRRRALILELLAAEDALYEELVNRLQGQSAAVLSSLMARMAELERRL